LPEITSLPDGSVAAIETTLNDMSLDVSVRRFAVYSRTGEQLRMTEEARVLSTKKPTPVPDEIVQTERVNSSNSGFKAPIYRGAHDLPFVTLIPK
jgi:hypothetical protein